MTTTRFHAAALAALALTACAGSTSSGNSSGGSTASAATTSAAAPQAGTRVVPLYTSGVTKIDRQGGGDYVIVTRDSIDTVAAWFRKNLPDQNGETVTSDGAHLFYTHNGATVDVEENAAHRFDKTDPARTSIGVVSPKDPQP